jgi:hypothetical protein
MSTRCVFSRMKVSSRTKITAKNATATRPRQRVRCRRAKHPLATERHGDDLRTIV